MINCGSVFPAYPSFVYLRNKQKMCKDFTYILTIMNVIPRFPFIIKWHSMVGK